jgi:hypothetical protein
MGRAGSLPLLIFVYAELLYANYNFKCNGMELLLMGRAGSLPLPIFVYARSLYASYGYGYNGTKLRVLNIYKNRHFP